MSGRQSLTHAKHHIAEAYKAIGLHPSKIRCGFEFHSMHDLKWDEDYFTASASIILEAVAHLRFIEQMLLLEALKVSKVGCQNTAMQFSSCSRAVFGIYRTAEAIVHLSHGGYDSIARQNLRSLYEGSVTSCRLLVDPSFSTAYRDTASPEASNKF